MLMSFFPVVKDQVWVDSAIFVELSSRHNAELISSVLGGADKA